MNAPLVVSIHDVAPSTADATRTWTRHLSARGVPATLLVIPGPWEGPPLRTDADLVAWLRERVTLGDEVAQHGWTHRRVPGTARWRRGVNALAARGCAEFVGVDCPEATRRVTWGRQVLRDLGFDPVGFTPPGWLASSGTTAALRDVGYRYTTSHTKVTDLHHDATIQAMVFSHRPGAASETIAAAVLTAGRAASCGPGVRCAWRCIPPIWRARRSCAPRSAPSTTRSITTRRPAPTAA